MLFTFPSRYWFAIGLLRVFSLGGWSRRIHTGFLVSRATQGSATLRMASCTGLSPPAAPLSSGFHSPCFLRSRGPTTPLRPEPEGFGLFPVRSPLLGESLLFSLPTGTKMFQFPAFASISINMDTSFEVGFPIRTSAGHRIFAPNRSFSQLITSFFASVSQGIRHAPFSRFFRDFVQYL